MLRDFCLGNWCIARAVNYDVHGPFWQFIDHWQTLIAGLLALIAAAGTIWITARASREQVKAARSQTNALLRSDRYRIAREDYAFFSMVIGTMTAVIEGTTAAQEIAAMGGSLTKTQENADAIRLVPKTGFSDIRAALIKSVGMLTDSFLKLETLIDHLSAKLQEVRHVNVAYAVASVPDLPARLDQIGNCAAQLKAEAERELRRCKEILSDSS